jgi:hypothetical protein
MAIFGNDGCLWKRGYALLVIDSGDIDSGTHGKREHIFRRERNEKERQ